MYRILKPQWKIGSPDKVRVGDVLLQKGLITAEDLSQALLDQRQSRLKLGEIFVQRGLLTRSQLRTALAEQKRRNWIAVALFTLGCFGTAVPKLANASPVSFSGSSAFSAQKLASRAGAQSNRFNTQPYSSLAANPNPTIASPLQGFCHPLNGLGYLSQGINGTTHRGRMAYAYDLGSSIGTPVYAMRAGRVLGVQDKYPDTGGGPDKISKFNYVMVEHDGGYRSAYVHLQQGFRSTVQIKAGDLVQKGQLIGYSGNSGWSTGPHLHIEIQRPGSPFTFTQTVPFAIAGVCDPSMVATVRQ
jgi:murein DD-endopeptidase MepM/ murein hydrolase activator NlpD